MEYVIIESPYSGAVKGNVYYLKLCILDSIDKGEIPFASHLFYTQVLDDNNEYERNKGINLGHKWILRADKVAVYTDLGISKGMEQGINFAVRNGIELSYRKLIKQSQAEKSISKRNLTMFTI